MHTNPQFHLLFSLSFQLGFPHERPACQLTPVAQGTVFGTPTEHAGSPTAKPAQGLAVPSFRRLPTAQYNSTCVKSLAVVQVELIWMRYGALGWT
jgi:hypothetical protein